MSAVVVSLRGGREARQMLDSLTGRELQNRVRRGTRRGAGVLRQEVRARAGSGGIPRRFKKTATKGHRNPVGTSTGPTSPLLNIFEVGADQHMIGAAGQLLRSGQGEPFFAARGPVRHPGMDARPLIDPVFRAKNEEAGEATADEILAGIPRR